MSEDVSVRPARSRWLRGCTVLAAIGLVAVVTFCSLSGAGIRSGLIHPPWIVRSLGPVQLVAISTLTPDCALEFPCGRPINVFDPNLRTYYVVWIVVSWPGAPKPGFTKYRLMIQPLDER